LRGNCQQTRSSPSLPAPPYFNIAFGQDSPAQVENLESLKRKPEATTCLAGNSAYIVRIRPARPSPG